MSRGGAVTTLDTESNSIAVIVKHIAGNMRRVWTISLTNAMRKPDSLYRDFELEARQ